MSNPFLLLLRVVRRAESVEHITIERVAIRLLRQRPKHLSALLFLVMLTSISTVTAVTNTNTRPTKTHVLSTRGPSTNTATHTVQVGPKTNPHAYVPNSIFANVGDVILFEFYPTNHSVVKADYLAPCVPASEGVFYSGMFDTFNEPDGELVGSPPTWSVVVNDTKPTFFYCTAIDSCIKNGMVGVINPDTTQTFQEQYTKALNYPYMLVPGQSIPAEGSSSSTADTNTHSSPSSTLSRGAIAGITVSSLVFVSILVLLFFVLGRNRLYSQWMSSQDGRNERTARWAWGGRTLTGPVSLSARAFNADTGTDAGIGTSTSISAGAGAGQNVNPWSRGSELDADRVNAPSVDLASVTSVSLPPYQAGQPGYGGGCGYAHGYGHGSGYGYEYRQGQGQEYGQGHWSWVGVQGSRVNRGPVELEAHGAGYWESEKGERDYR